MAKLYAIVIVVLTAVVLGNPLSQHIATSVMHINPYTLQTKKKTFCGEGDESLTCSDNNMQEGSP